MLIPVGTDRPLRRRTVMTWVLIVVTVACFAVQVITGLSGPDATGEGWVYGPMDRLFSLHRSSWPTDPNELAETSQVASTPWYSGVPWWTFITYAFLHASWWHLAGNMVFLWAFGPNIEDRFGRLGFLVFYLAGAAVAGTLQIIFEPAGVVGASGAIAACTGAYLIMFPRAMVRAFSLLFVLGFVSLPAWWFIGFSIVWDLIAQGSGSATGVAHLAHLGGYGFGAAVAFALLGFRVMPREPYDVFSMARQAYRRQEIRSAVRQQERQTERRLGRPAAPALAVARPSESVERSAALADARAEVVRLLASGDRAAAAAAYKQLADRFPAVQGGTSLSRRHQYELASHYFTTGDHGAAVYAFERFLEAYPKDPEAPQIRLLLGRVNARYMNDPVRAKTLLTEAMAGLRDEESRDMARRELEALG